ncbi:MAG: UDP-glucose 4-epimerase GalE [Acidimicrobiia bacterium]|nr:UDP-glucose 4-epimerase GalE [Acidimicrobiia bacterium]
MTRTILVTGGAGYIGSHTSVLLLQRGFDIVIADDLSNSSLRAVETIEVLGDRRVAFEEVDLTDQAAVAGVFDRHPIEGVIHFAGVKAVGESVQEPLRYYRTNLTSAMNLLDEMAAHEVWDLVFSSSATVYGDPEMLPIDESAPTRPTNPYGRTKLMIEDICRDVARADRRWRINLLRYFNPIGAHSSGDLGEDPRGIPNNLVPFVMQVAVGRRQQVEVFGNDWDTPDGTGVRDYIHVLDLAEGHLAALDHLETGCDELNLGTGHGASVFEVIKTTENVSGKAIPFEVVDRRAGDIACSLAEVSKANRRLDWRADRNLEVMLSDAWRWQSKHPEGYGD